MAIEDLREIGNVLYRVGADGVMYPVRRLRADQTPARSQPTEPGLLSGTGIPERAAQFNQMLNPIEAIGGSMDASRRMAAPNATGWDRVQALGDMLSGVAGVAAPAAIAGRAGAPAAKALMEGLLGWSPTREAAGDMARGFVADESGGLVNAGLGLPTPRNDAEAMARDILQLRAEGRAADVTDEMMAAADPQYMFYNTPLPMDYASRMARADNWPTPLTEDSIHGTLSGKDFTSFKGDGRIGQEVYVAPNTDAGHKLSAQFSSGDQGRIMPLRTPTPLDTSTLDDRLMFEQMMDDKNRLDDFRMKGGYRASGLPGWGDQWAIDTVGEAGIPALKLHERDWVTSTAVFDPRNIRSRFARFDPEFAHLRNLSAAVAAGLPLGLLAMQPDQEQY